MLNTVNLNTNFYNSFSSNWQDKIQKVFWRVGGNSSSYIQSGIPSTTYQYEVKNPSATNTTDNKTTYEANIGLMYIFDYDYAASSSAWSLYNYNSDTTKSYVSAISINWLFMGPEEHTITRHTNRRNSQARIYSNGAIYNGYSSNKHTVRPCFYLNKNVMYEMGDGSFDNPFRITL